MTTERVTLYGLPIVEGRRVQLGRVDPALARTLFIEHALVDGDWRTHHAFVAANRALVDELEDLEERTRRRDLLVTRDRMVDFFAARVPDDVVSARHFDRWWKDARRTEPDLLTFTRDDLLDPDADGVDLDAFPTTWRQGDLAFDVSYTFGPGAHDDGVTVHVPLAVLNQVRPDGFDWQVPGHRLDLVTALVRSLPKAVRRHLVPAPDRAREALRSIGPDDGPLLDVLARRLATLAGEGVAAGRLRPDQGARPPAGAVPHRGRRGRRGGQRPRPRRAAAPTRRPRAAGRRRRGARHRTPRADHVGHRDAAPDRRRRGRRPSRAGLPGAARRGRLGGGAGHDLGGRPGPGHASGNPPAAGAGAAGGAARGRAAAAGRARPGGRPRARPVGGRPGRRLRGRRRRPDRRQRGGPAVGRRGLRPADRRRPVPAGAAGGRRGGPGRRPRGRGRVPRRPPRRHPGPGPAARGRGHAGPAAHARPARVRDGHRPGPPAGPRALPRRRPGPPRQARRPAGPRPRADGDRPGGRGPVRGRGGRAPRARRGDPDVVDARWLLEELRVSFFAQVAGDRPARQRRSGSARPSPPSAADRPAGSRALGGRAPPGDPRQ